MILYLLKCNVFEDFEVSMNIMYLTAKDVASERKKIKIVIFENLIKKNIFKLFNLEIIIISIEIVWQQKIKITINKFNKFAKKAIEENNVNFEKRFL